MKTKVSPMVHFYPLRDNHAALLFEEGLTLRGIAPPKNASLSSVSQSYAQ